MSNHHWQPNARVGTLLQRARLMRTIRHFFAKRNVLEVSTPVIVSHGVSDPHLDSFSLGNMAGYLRTSPEYALKRLLAAGSGDIYELGPVFREGEAGHSHNPEFTMLEWYRIGWNYHQLMDEVVELIADCSPDRLALWPIAKMSYSQLSEQKFNADISTMAKAELLDIARSHGWHAHADDTSKSILLDFIFSHILQPTLAQQSISIVYDFPECQSALAQIYTNGMGNRFARRFEVFLESTELANGYQELTDANEQLSRFIEDQRIREQLNKDMIEHDQNLLDALRHGLPDCAGVALGVDRLLLGLTNDHDIADTLAFSWQRR